MTTNTDNSIVKAPAGHLSREQILNVTLGCLREQGYDETTIRRIAGRLRCAVGSIYRYFTDKRELLLSTTQQVLDPVIAELDQGASLEQSFELYSRIAQQDGESYRLMFWLACIPNSLALPGETDAALPPTAEKRAADSIVAPHLLPPIVSRIVDRWGEQLGNREQALRAWSVLHGVIAADLPASMALSMIASMQPSAAARSDHPAMAQLVTLLTKPKASSRPESPLADAKPVVDVTETRSAVPASAGARSPEDVTLL